MTPVLWQPTIWVAAVAVFLAGCSATGVVMNPPLGAIADNAAVGINRLPNRKSATSPNRTTIVLAFSGGGTRAAALSYGVLKGLRDVPLPGQPQYQESNLIGI